MTTAKGKYGGRKVRDGTVVSDKMQKTVLVAVEEHITHPLYKKRVRRLRRFMAHDEREDAHMGDRVRILEAAPISKRKRWQVVEILQRVELPEVAPESIDLELLGEVKREDDETEAVVVPAGVAPADLEPDQEAASGVIEPEAEPVAEAEEVAVEEAEEAESEAAEAEVEAAEEAEPAPEEFDETPEASPEEVALATGEDEAEVEPEGEEKPA
jgi:small subunit ribosomal protein S17